MSMIIKINLSAHSGPATQVIIHKYDPHNNSGIFFFNFTKLWETVKQPSSASILALIAAVRPNWIFQMQAHMDGSKNWFSGNLNLKVMAGNLKKYLNLHVPSFAYYISYYLLLLHNDDGNDTGMFSSY